jgi:hypothetical protein
MTTTPRRATHSALKVHATRAATLLEITADLAECERAATRLAHYDAVLAQAGAEIAVDNAEKAKRRSLAAYKANRARTIAAQERLLIKLTGIDHRNADLVPVH